MRGLIASNFKQVFKDLKDLKMLKAVSSEQCFKMYAEGEEVYLLKLIVCCVVIKPYNISLDRINIVMQFTASHSISIALR